jgi:hypothetical protein
MISFWTAAMDWVSHPRDCAETTRVHLCYSVDDVLAETRVALWTVSTLTAETIAMGISYSWLFAF